jgi:hypothetical protein
LLVLLAATVGVGRTGQSVLRQRPRPSVAALPAIPFLKVASLGYREAAADLAWMQAVQYYGEYRQRGNDLSEFDHYLDVVNTLDPRYEHAYVLGAVVMATDGGDLPAALDILRRGWRANPHSGTCAFEMGFLCYIVGNDVDAALRYFRLAGEDPAWRERSQRFQAFLSRRLGRLETSWLLWKDLYDHTENSSLKIVAQESMRRIERELAQPKEAP